MNVRYPLTICVHANSLPRPRTRRTIRTEAVPHAPGVRRLDGRGAAVPASGWSRPQAEAAVPSPWPVRLHSVTLTTALVPPRTGGPTRRGHQQPCFALWVRSTSDRDRQPPRLGPVGDHAELWCSLVREVTHQAVWQGRIRPPRPTPGIPRRPTWFSADRARASRSRTAPWPIQLRTVCGSSLHVRHVRSSAEVRRRRSLSSRSHRARGLSHQAFSKP
jgi:hypothetical protein